MPDRSGEVPPAGVLRLRPLSASDEGQVAEAHRLLLADGFTFALGYQPDLTWTEYLAQLEAARLSTVVDDDRVPATFLVAEVAGRIVGRTSIRHALNAFLLREGGHIGFGVVPDQRRKGFATAILTESLNVARSVGIQHVLVTCDEDNIGSAAVIERCGGVLDPRPVPAGRRGLRRYWIG